MVTAGKVMAMTFAELVASNAALSGEVRRSHEALKIAQLTIDKMKVELAYLRRMKYGRSSEKLEHAQLELVGGQVAPPVVEPPADADTDDGLKSNVTSLDKERKKREPKTRPGLRELPAHLPRRTVVHTPARRMRLHGLWRWPAGDRSGRLGGSGLRAGHLPRGAPRAPEAGLRRLQDDHAGAGAEPADGPRAWPAPVCSRTLR